jgi:hypothetical protein
LNLVLLLALALPLVAQDDPAAIPTPESVFGFTPGTDRRLIDYSQLTDYVERAAEASGRVELLEIGRSTLDRPMLVVFISSEDNITRLDELKEINRRLALDADLSPSERADLVERGRVFVMATLSMHANEVAPAQTLPLLVHELAAAEDGEVREWLDDVVVMVVASLNPDGMDMMVDHYRKSLDTPFEGGRMPGLYHHYVGHDNNRDFLSLNLSESRAVSRAYSTEWFPQVLLDKHQMGRTGPRYFVPRYHDPIAENIDGSLWNWSDVFGSAMAREMAESGHTGIASNWVFDEYWPGATTTSHWKNVISILTEGASSRLGTPVFVEKNEFRVRGKGLSEYKKSVNMPELWPGGWWRLGDQVQYELASWRGALKTASLLREDILDFRNRICVEEVTRGRTEAPFYYVIPQGQHDHSETAHLVDLLVAHGVEVAELGENVVVDGVGFTAGDLVVPMAQPYRPFVKEAMEVQHYPVRHYTPGGEIIRPYDITSWSLPLHLGVRAIEIDEPSEILEAGLRPYTAPDAPLVEAGSWGIAVDPRDNAAFRAAFTAAGSGSTVLRTTEAAVVAETELPAGAFLVRRSGDDVMAAMEDTRWVPLDDAPDVPTRPIDPPRVALVESWYHHMDAGWTRFVLESYGVSYTLLRPGDVAETDLAGRFDVVILPDEEKDILLNGAAEEPNHYRPNDYRPEYRKGFGTDGMEKLHTFIEGGGRVVAWGHSCEVLLDPMSFGEGDDAIEVSLPVRDDTKRLEEDGFYAPGTLLRMELVEDHPLTLGMPAETGVFTRGRPVLATGLPTLVTDRRVVGFFPEREIVMSGYAENTEALAGRPAMVWARAGKGQVVLFGFGPQFRASTPTTYKLLFNAILLPEIPDDKAGVAGVF